MMDLVLNIWWAHETVTTNYGIRNGLLMRRLSATRVLSIPLIPTHGLFKTERIVVDGDLFRCQVNLMMVCPFLKLTVMTT